LDHNRNSLFIAYLRRRQDAASRRYAPLDLVVRCQAERRRTVNRFLALQELVDRIEMKVSPGTSERLRKAERRRRNRARAGRRARARHQGDDTAARASSSDPAQGSR
jgi:protein subunit release factor B